MSAIKRFMKDSMERLKVDELLRKELRNSGYGGITMTKTPMGTQITLYTMWPGRVIGKRGAAIKELTARLERDLGIPNPQIAVVEVEVPELNPFIMASRIAMAIERGVHYRRAIFWAARRIMDAGVEAQIKGKIRGHKSRCEVVREGFIPQSGQPALEQVETATVSVKGKQGVQGITSPSSRQRRSSPTRYPWRDYLRRLRWWRRKRLHLRKPVLTRWLIISFRLSDFKLKLARRPVRIQDL